MNGYAVFKVQTHSSIKRQTGEGKNPFTCFLTNLVFFYPVFAFLFRCKELLFFIQGFKINDRIPNCYFYFILLYMGCIEMKPQNVISVLYGAAALETLGENVDKRYKVLKPHEIRTMAQFCHVMQDCGCKINHFDGFYVGYIIQQINKEFDLLRFGKESILNIEIKSELKTANKEDKVLQQMRKNFYYLKFLGRKVNLFSYVEKDGFFRYREETDSLERIKESDVAQELMEQETDYSIDPDSEFVPSSYLISPFNSTERFMDGEYFLTQAQEKRKVEIHDELVENPFMFFCLSANAGTGKTLLLYDIAKQ